MNSLPIDFMRRVVAWPGPDGPGFCNVHWKSGNPNFHGLPGKPFKTLDDLMGFVQYAAAPSRRDVFSDIYFCLSTQRRAGTTGTNGKPRAHRHADDAIALKAIWLDIDIGSDGHGHPEKGYATYDEAVDGFVAFREVANLPPPSAIVNSGGGMHLYWFSTRALTPAEWEPYAEGLKVEALRHGLRSDAGIIADAARVLRVPGTYNAKLRDTPRPVVLMHLGDDYDFATDLAHIAAKAPVRAPALNRVTATVIPAAFDVSGWPPSVVVGLPDPMADNLADGIRSLDLPLDPAEMEKLCLHFKDASVTHGKDDSQGLWALSMLAATFMVDGEAKAHEWSNGYPTYDPGETQAKYEEKLLVSKRTGWPGCSAFEAEGVKCQTCPFYQRIKSPLSLAKQIVVEGVSTRPPTPPPPADLDLPPGYTVNPEGRICAIVQKEDKKTKEHYDVLEPLFACRLRNFMPQAGVRRLNFETQLDGNNWAVVSVPEEFIGSEAKLVEALWQGGVKVNPDHRRKVPQFMTSFLEKMDAARVRPHSISYGWLESPDGGLPLGFAYNGRVYLADGSTQTAGASDVKMDQFYTPKGSPDPWHQALKIVTVQHHPALEAIIAVAFAGPLMRFSGQYNGAIWPYSYEGGAHKSTSVNIGAAVWGSPQETKERVGASIKGVFRKMGYLRNIPIFYDEINEQTKLDAMRDTLGELTEGGGGTKLQSNRSFHDRETWQTLVLAASNKSLTDNILKTHPDTNAALERVYEFLVEKRGDTLPFHEVSRLVGDLDTNYGHMGIKYAQYLGTHAAEVSQMLDTTMTRLSAITTPDSRERFRAFMVGTLYVGAVIANRLGATFNTSELWEYLVTEFIRQRRLISGAATVAGTPLNTSNLISRFVKASTRNVLWITHIPMKRPGQPSAVSYLAGPSQMRPDPIHIRYCVNDRLMQLSKAKLTDWLAVQNQSARPLVASLMHHFAAYEERLTLSAGSGVAGGPKEAIITVPVPVGSPFEGDLHEHEKLGPMPDTTGIVTAAVTPALVGATP